KSGHDLLRRTCPLLTQSGHRSPHSQRYFEPVRCLCPNGGSNEAARVHHASRRRGDYVVACCTRAADHADAANWCAELAYRKRSERKGGIWIVSQAVRGTWLECSAQSVYRSSLGQRRSKSDQNLCRRTDNLETRRAPRLLNSGSSRFVTKDS